MQHTPAKPAVEDQGIAVIVVVAIMVALIMVTTALLATVRRSTASASAYFQRDVARLATIAGRSEALSHIRAIAGTEYIYSNTIMSSTYADTPALTASNLETVAYGLEPYAKNGVIGQRYGTYCPVRPPYQAVIDGISYTCMRYSTSSDVSLTKTTYYNGAGNANTGLTTALNISDILPFAQADTDLIDTTTGTVGYASTKYSKYLTVAYYDKDFATSSTALAADSFYVTKFAINVQDLGGRLCINDDPNMDGNSYNCFTQTVLSDIVSKLRTGGQSWTTFDAAKFVSGTTYTPAYSQEDIASRLRIYNDSRLLELQQLTPWGKEDSVTKKTPFCVNIYTISEKLLNAIVTNIVDNAGIKVHKAAIPEDATAVPPVAAVPGIDVSLSVLTATEIQKIVAIIMSDRKDVTKKIPDIANDICTYASFSANQKKAACLLSMVLLGSYVDTDLDDDTATTGAASHLPFVCNSSNVSYYTSAPSDVYGAIEGLKLGRLVGVDSDKVELPVDASVIGPGPFFHVTVKGVLINLGKTEIVSSANYEFVYYYNKTTPANSKIVYQRWYENE